MRVIATLVLAIMLALVFSGCGPGGFLILIGAAAGGGGGSPAPFASDYTWTQRSNNIDWVGSPAERMDPSMAFASSDQRIYMFGGHLAYAGDQYVYYNELWAWDGTNWENVNVIGNAPPHRSRAAMVYDSTLNLLIVFGGTYYDNFSYTFYDDTWHYSLDNRAWTKSPVTYSPSGRETTAMAYDPSRNQSVLFGGWDTGGPCSDTWIYYYSDFSETWTWQQRYPGGDYPGSISWHCMEYNPQDNSVMLFGGWDGYVFKNDVYKYVDYTTFAWTRVATSGTKPPARRSFAMAYDNYSRELLIYGGNIGTDAKAVFAADVWTLSSANVWQKLSVNNPYGEALFSSGHAMAYMPWRRAFVSHGGWDDYEWHARTLEMYRNYGANKINVYRRTSNLGPIGRESFGMYADINDPGKIRMFGGYADDGSYKNDMWAWDVYSAAWSQDNATNPPEPRYSAALGYCNMNYRAVLFGGINSGEYVLGDTWLYDSSAKSWQFITPSTSPIARYGTAVAGRTDGYSPMIFGGCDGSFYYDDLYIWKYDVQTWEQQPTLNNPPARVNATMVYDEIMQMLYLFGGEGASGKMNDLWSLNIYSPYLTWNRIPASGGPSPRSYQAMALMADGQPKVLIVHGGADESGKFLADTWAFNLDGNFQWEQVIPAKYSLLPPRAGHSLVFDNGLDQAVLFGGWNGFWETGSVWHLEYTPVP